MYIRISKFASKVFAIISAVSILFNGSVVTAGESLRTSNSSNCLGGVLPTDGNPNSNTELVYFEENSIDYILKSDSQKIPCQVAKKVHAEKDKGQIFYSIDKVDIGLGIDSKDAKLEVIDWGKLSKAIIDSDNKLKVIITANKEEAPGFQASIARYSLNIKFKDIDLDFEEVCALSLAAQNGWYNISNPAVVQIKNQYQEKYSIAKCSTILSEENSELKFETAEDQGEGLHYIYLIDRITHQIYKPWERQLKIDVFKPDNMSIEYKQNSFFSRFLSFNKKDEVNITFKATDAHSGLAHLNWYYVGEHGKNKETGTLTFDENNQANLSLSLSQFEPNKGNIKFTVTDKAGNTSDFKDDAGNTITLDTTSPKCNLEYRCPLQEYNSKKYYDGELEFAFIITEPNFSKEGFTTIVKKDGEEIYPDIFWEETGTEIHIARLKLKEDGEYTIEANCADESGNKMDPCKSGVIVIDTKVPELGIRYEESTKETIFEIQEHNFDPKDISVAIEAKDIKGNSLEIEDITEKVIEAQNWKEVGTDRYVCKLGNYADGIYSVVLSYTDLSNHKVESERVEFVTDRTKPSTPEISYSEDYISRLETLFFYSSKFRVTLSAKDQTSGIKNFDLYYKRSANAVGVDERFHLEVPAKQSKEDPSRYIASIELPPLETSMLLRGQLRGNLSATATDKSSNTSNKITDEGREIVVDTISPTMTAEYSVSDREMEDIRYYGRGNRGKFTGQFKIKESNFFAEDVEIKLTKDEEEIPVSIDWSRGEDEEEHIGSCEIANGDGEYRFIVNYRDKSNNEMKTYQSDKIVIDTQEPKVSVEYKNRDEIKELEDFRNRGEERKYYNRDQVAVVKIEEEHFRKEDVEFDISAKDITGRDLDISKLVSFSDWRHEDNIHVIEISYHGEANYSFGIRYKDLAGNSLKSYKIDHFTIDKTAPVVESVAYSEGVLNTYLGGTQFNFYNSEITVTVMLEDNISGVDEFIYSYINSENVSNVNSQLIGQAAEIRYLNSHRTAVVNFKIPKSTLRADNQFNGTISFSAKDRSGNGTQRREGQRLVVDNITPEMLVTYNEPVNTENGIHYYDNSIRGNIHIREANFYPEDVRVQVSVNGGAETTLPTTWENKSADVYLGSFILNDDADYVISIQYKDKSSNTVSDYHSNQLTIDTKIDTPTYAINGVSKDKGHAGAYKENVHVEYNFSDQNYSANDIKLTKTRFDKTEDVSSKFINSTTTANGGAGSFEITNEIENDGIYLLTVSLTDKVGHQTESSLKFTVNRYGSVFEYSDYLCSIIQDGGQFIRKINGDTVSENLFITEYNADQLVPNSNKIIITRDGERIQEKYTQSSNSPDGWYQCFYDINKNNFIEDGQYNILISSKDTTGNESICIPDNSINKSGAQVKDNIKFTIDTTAPEIVNLSNLDKSIVNAQSVNVNYSILDAGGLKQIDILVNGEIRDRISDFGDNIYNFNGSFEIFESNYQQTVQLKIVDLAGNITDTNSEDFKPSNMYTFNRGITVSTNFFVRWYANKILFWGSILVLSAIVIVIFTLISKLRVNHKKDYFKI